MEILHQLGIYGPLVVLQAASFFVMMLILKRFLFDRVRHFMEARKGEEARQRDEVLAARKALEEAEARLRGRLAENEKKAYDYTQAEVKTGIDRKTAVVAEAQEKARRELADVRKQVAIDRATALRIEMRRDIEELALLAAGNAMGTKLDSSKATDAAASAVAGALAGRPA